VWEHYRRYYRPSELVVTAAGGLNHDVVCRLVLEALRNAGWQLEDGAAPVERRSTVAAEIFGRPGLTVVKRQVEQANVIVGCPSITATDDRRYVMSVLNAILGGGMSSRLFQEIREKRGLVYSTYSFASAYADAGYFGMYGGCSPAKVPQVLALMDAELSKLATHGVTEDELRKAVGQLSGGIVLALEDTGSRMSRLGRAELVSGEFQDVDETLSQIRGVTAEQVRGLAAQLAAAPRSVTVVGPFEETETFGLNG
jgi:predicted Zn-dependent peptidase